MMAQRAGASTRFDSRSFPSPVCRVGSMRYALYHLRETNGVLREQFGATRLRLINDGL
jgi:hypothetical protein